MKTLAIDIETYSSVSIQKCGVYAYSSSHDFEVFSDTLGTTAPSK